MVDGRPCQYHIWWIWRPRCFNPLCGKERKIYDKIGIRNCSFCACHGMEKMEGEKGALKTRPFCFIIVDGGSTDSLTESSYAMKKRLLIFLAVVLVGALAFGSYTLIRQRKAQQADKDAQLAALQQAQVQELVPLRAEESQLEQRIAALNTSLPENKQQMGSATVFFRGPYEELSTQVQQVMDIYGVKGTILLTEDMFPGKEGMLTVDALRSLTDDGWDLAILLQDLDAMTKLIADMEACSLPAPKVLYLSVGVSTQYLTECVNRFGFQAVVTWSDVTVPDGVLMITAHSHQDDATTINNLFDYLRNNLDYTAVTISFASGEQDYYNSARLNSILNYCAYYSMEVAPASTVAKNALAKDETDEEAVRQELEEATQRLEEVRQQIKKITTYTGIE